MDTTDGDLHRILDQVRDLLESIVDPSASRHGLHPMETLRYVRDRLAPHAGASPEVASLAERLRDLYLVMDAEMHEAVALARSILAEDVCLGTE